MRQSPLTEKSFALAVRIVKLYKILVKESQEYVLSKQLLRSGTAIGALIAEARFAQTRADFITKLSIAAKEANETLYWLSLLKETEILKEEYFDAIYPDADEIMKLLTTSLKTARANATPKN